MPRLLFLYFFLASSFLLLEKNTVNCLRHSFYVKNDDRSLIGPVGEPFGFLAGGQYDIKIFDFELSSKKKKSIKKNKWFKKDSKNKKKPYKEAMEAEDTDGDDPDISGLEAGFFLTRFENEASFNQYMEFLATNTTRCSFEYFRDDYYFNGYDTDISNSIPYYIDDDFGLLYDIDDEFSDVGDFITAEHGIFVSMMERKYWKPGTKSFTYTFDVGEEGLYFLIYQICPADDKRIQDIRTSFELDLHFKNYDSFGNVSYLTAGEMCLPILFLFFTLSYGLCLGIWVYNIIDIRNGNSGLFDDEGSPSVFAIHHLMGVLLLIRTIATFFESVRYHYIRSTGQAQLWSFVYYSFAFIKGMFLFTVILLIGSGWSSMKPFLNQREKKVIFAVLILQTTNQLVFTILSYETEGERMFDQWTAVFHIIDIICCCAILLPIVWQVDALEKSVEGSNLNNGDNYEPVDQEADDAGNLVGNNQEEYYEDEYDEAEDKVADKTKIIERLKLFRSFYLLVVAYIYSTRILVYLFVTMLDYRHLYVRHLVVELLTLAFYVVTGLKFKPKVEVIEGKKPFGFSKDDTIVSESELEMMVVPAPKSKPKPKTPKEKD